MSDPKAVATRAGSSAAQYGLRRMDNPFAPGTELREAWDRAFVAKRAAMQPA